jgi:hypothetical protein
MAAINHAITEEQLKEAYHAVKAVQQEKGHTELEAIETARILTYGVFRGVITFESLIDSIIGNARKVYTH